MCHRRLSSQRIRRGGARCCLLAEKYQNGCRRSQRAWRMLVVRWPAWGAKCLEISAAADHKIFECIFCHDVAMRLACVAGAAATVPNVVHFEDRTQDLISLVSEAYQIVRMLGRIHSVARDEVCRAWLCAISSIIFTSGLQQKKKTTSRRLLEWGRLDSARESHQWGNRWRYVMNSSLWVPNFMIS